MERDTVQELAKILKVLADHNRLRIIKLLECRKMCVCELAYALNVTQPSISRHLKKMKQAGLVDDEQDGFWTNYYLKKSDTFSLDLLNVIKKKLKNDRVVREDAQRLGKVDRKDICC